MKSTSTSGSPGGPSRPAWNRSLGGLESPGKTRRAKKNAILKLDEAKSQIRDFKISDWTRPISKLRLPLGRITQVKPPPLPALLMQSAELHSHPLGVLDLEAGLGAPGVLQIAALELGLDPILLRVPVRNGVGDVIHFGRTALSATPRDKNVIAEHQTTLLLSVVLGDLHPQEIHIEVADLLVVIHLIRDVVDVEGLERLASSLGFRHHPGRPCRRCCRHT